MKKHNGSPKKPVFDAEGYQVNLKDLNGETLPDAARVKFKHGGVRAGAGRKPVGRKAILLRLSPSVIAALRARAKAEHKTLSDIAEERLVIA